MHLALDSDALAQGDEEKGKRVKSTYCDSTNSDKDRAVAFR